MSTITRKSILLDKYLEFQMKLEKEGINGIFPSFEDFIELLFFIDLKFGNTSNYKKDIKELIDNFSPIKITEEEFDKIFPIIESFIKYILYDFKELK